MSESSDLCSNPVNSSEQNGKAEFRTMLKSACEGHSVQVALENSMPACAPEGDWVIAPEQPYTSRGNGTTERELMRLRRGEMTLEQFHDMMYPSDSDEDQDDDMPDLVDSSASGDEEEEPRVYLVDDRGGLTSLSQL